MQRISENWYKYFPIKFINNRYDDFDTYLSMLFKTLDDNYNNENYQAAYLYNHLIFMCYIYNCILLISQIEPIRFEDVYASIKTYNGKPKPNFKEMSIYDLSRISEKDIFVLLRCINSDQTSNLSEYIDNRNKYAHAGGYNDITKIILDDELENQYKIIDRNHLFFKPYIEKIFIEKLKAQIENKEKFMPTFIEDLIEINFSIIHLNDCKNIGLNKYRNQSIYIKENYSFFKSYLSEYKKNIEESYFY